MLDLSKYKSILTFFAHPDDETLAAGATINKLTNQGATINVAIPATGINSRGNTQTKKECHDDLIELRADCVHALDALGVVNSNIHLGEFSDNEMDRGTLLELVHWLEDILEIVEPDLIITHHRYCTNIDHQYCHDAAVVATRPSLGSHIPVLCAEVPSSTGYLKPVQWEPNCHIEVSEEDVHRKIMAMERYKGESRPDPHPRSKEVLLALAKVRGSESGFYFAEAFMISKIFG